LRNIWAALAVLASCTVPSAAEGKKVADLALILAVDCSGSVDRREFQLQLSGIATAFRDPLVIAAAQGGRHGKIIVNMMLWADPDEPKLTSGWYEIGSAEEAERFAAMAGNFNTLIGGGTGIGVAIGYGISLLNGSGYDVSRKTIDVSGDGKETWELREPRFRLLQAQALLKNMNITVNGLAISNDYPDLVNYYRQNVAHGSGSFVIEARSYADFAEAMRIKLLREILPSTASTSDFQP
jgi:Protein of unknown function (DUF1194)